MTYGDAISRVDFNMRRDDPFSYACHACNRCCNSKAIRVSPYEILLLARFLEASTTDFIEKHTEAGGTVLQIKQNGDCGFLGENGCGVHPARPLACRIYPLARWVDPDGDETFGNLVPHPLTEGLYGRDSTVQDYLNQQRVAPFFAAGDIYSALYLKMVDLLQQVDPEESGIRAARRTAIDEMPAGSIVSLWTDIDATLAASGEAADEPTIAIEKHVAIIEAWLARHGG